MSVMDIVRLLFLIIETPLLIALIVYIIKIERLRVVYIHPENGCISLKWKVETDGDIALWNRRAE